MKVIQLMIEWDSLEKKDRKYASFRCIVNDLGVEMWRPCKEFWCNPNSLESLHGTFSRTRIAFKYPFLPSKLSYFHRSCSYFKTNHLTSNTYLLLDYTSYIYQKIALKILIIIQLIQLLSLVWNLNLLNEIIGKILKCLS